MLGVFIGVVLLLLLIGLVVLQGAIEWGKFDFDSIFKKKEGPAKTVKAAAAPAKTAKKKKAAPAKKAKAGKKGKGKR